MVPPKPRKGAVTTLEGVIAHCLKDHRGKVLMDCRWYCICGWTSPRAGVPDRDHVEAAQQQGREHQADHIAKALAEQAKREQEETAS